MKQFDVAHQSTETLSPNAQQLLRFISFVGNRHGTEEVTLSDAQAAERANISHNGLVRAQQELKAAGIVRVVQGKRTARYFILKPDKQLNQGIPGAEGILP